MRNHARSLGRLLVSALLASALTTPGAGASPQIIRHEPKALGTIGGQVFNPSGFAVSGARVTLQTADGKSPQTTVTNDQGRFWFPMLDVGMYDVRAASEGHSSEWRQNVGVRIGRQTTITLHLPSKKPAPIKAPASLKRPLPENRSNCRAAQSHRAIRVVSVDWHDKIGVFVWHYARHAFCALSTCPQRSRQKSPSRHSKPSSLFSFSCALFQICEECAPLFSYSYEHIVPCLE